MALTADEIATLVEITGIGRVTLVDYYLPGLTTASQAILSADIALWNANRNKTTRIAGGRDALFVDPQILLDRIRQRVFAQLEIDSSLIDGGGGGNSFSARIVRS